MTIKRIPLEERFWAKVEKRASSECWVWRGYRLPKGYGTIGLAGHRGSKILTHRLAYALVNGPIPEYICVLHSCDNPPCVNPAHLFLGTQKVNVDDMIAKGRQRHARGASNGRPKLNECDVRNIRIEFAKGDVTQASLAYFFGVTPSVISRVIGRQKWVHVT